MKSERIMGGAIFDFRVWYTRNLTATRGGSDD